MNEWKKSMTHITFDSKEDVLSKIEAMHKEKMTLKDKLIKALNYELVIPTQSLIALCSIVTIAFGIKITEFRPQTYNYEITVINERGEHEKTY